MQGSMLRTWIGGSQPHKTRAVRPRLEALEDRKLLYATYGGSFTYGSRITYSFMPDGTSLGGVGSNLISTMDSRFSRTAWQNAFANAAATWSAVAKINLVQVSDNGTPLNGGNYQQGDPAIGDIRIGGYSQNNSTLAYAFQPPAANGGSLAGDILFNTSQLWQINRDYDLQTVAMHELGHALGLDHSTVSSAVMNAYYNGVRQSLSSDDVAGIQSIWGTRTPDWTNGSSGNATMATAYDTSPNYNSNIGQVVMWDLSMNSTSEYHWYKVTTPISASTTFSATVQSTGLSLLQPRVQIYNANGSGLAQTYGQLSPTGSATVATITNALPNTTYYIRTSAGTSGPAGIGAYALLVNMGSNPTYTVPPPNTTVARQADQGGGTSSQTSSLSLQRARDTVGGIPVVDEVKVVSVGTISAVGDDFRIRPRDLRSGKYRVVGHPHPTGVARDFVAQSSPARRSFSLKTLASA